MKGGSEWRAGGGEGGDVGPYEEGNGRGEGERAGRGVAAERKGEERKDGGGSSECYFFKNGKTCPYVEKWGDCKFAYVGEKGGIDQRVRGRRVEKRAAPGGEGAGEKKSRKNE